MVETSPIPQWLEGAAERLEKLTMLIKQRGGTIAAAESTIEDARNEMQAFEDEAEKLRAFIETLSDAPQSNDEPVHEEDELTAYVLDKLRTTDTPLSYREVADTRPDIDKRAVNEVFLNLERSGDIKVVDSRIVAGRYPRKFYLLA